MAAGLGTPRPAIHLEGSPEAPRVLQSNDSKQDMTPLLIQAFTPYLPRISELDGYILMNDSPSCGLSRVKVYTSDARPPQRVGRGLFASAICNTYPTLPVEESGRLNDAKLLENFCLRVYAHHRFRHEVQQSPSVHRLQRFHASYKFVLLAHDQAAYRRLGQLVASIRTRELNEALKRYLQAFMMALAQPPKRGNHTNTLLHLLGYLRPEVSHLARRDIAATIERYRQGHLPLSTPLTLIRHYVQQVGDDYIKSQRYLNPYPDNLGLANRV